MILAPLTYATYVTIEDLKVKDYQPKGYKWPDITDFWVSLVIAFLWITFDHVIKVVSFPCIYKIARD